MRAFVGLTALALLASAYAVPAEARTPVGYTYSTPSTGKADRRCSGGDQGACRLDQALVRRIRATPCTGRIDAIVYSATYQPLVDALLARARCGTQVRLVTSLQRGQKWSDFGELKRLVDGLAALHEHVKVCAGSCSKSGSSRIMHLKLMAFSSTGGTKYVVVSGSGNLTYQTDTAYNDELAWADRQSYLGVVRWAGLLARDRTIKGEPGVIRSKDGRRTLYLHPAYSKNVPLSVARKARGRKGCVIDAGYLYYSGGDAEAMTAALIARRKEGARVRVAANAADDGSGHWSAAQLRRLARAGVEVHDTWQWVDRSRGTKVYVHRKVLVVTGCGKVKDQLVQGSTTMTKTARAYNDNADVVDTDAPDVWAARHGFGVMIAHGRRVAA